MLNVCYVFVQGINLSGGQQQRLSLARAVYNDADIVLLDDILSAVDAHVGKHIFDKCINGYLRGKTVVLVTHQVALSAKHADRIVVMNSDGTVRESGTYHELSRGKETYLTEILTSLNGPESLQRQGSNASIDSSTSTTTATTTTATKVQSSDTSKTAATAIGDSKKPAADDGSKGKIITKEAIAQGNPKLTLYLKYFRFCGGQWFAIAWLVLSFAWQALTVAQSFTLKTWINEMTAGQNNGPGFWKYVIVSIASFGALLARTVLITGGSIKASKSVHDAITARVFGAPVSFFDQTPLGRIFNRFSSDIVTLDKDLMNDINTYSDMLFSVIGVVAVVAVSIPWLILAMFPVLGLCYYYGARYLQTSRQLKRLESVNRSPLYAHFSESVNGASTIRSYEAEKRFIAVNEQHTDVVNRSHIYLWCANYWVTNRVRLLGSIVCGLVGLFLVLDVDNIDSASGGLVLTYVLQYTIAGMLLLIV
jgi:ATP-binding cassette, subfamily C (CFTR/MRP), member 1